MLPNFICIGAPKSGTTTFYEIVKQHPDIAVSSFKEPGFFDNDANWEKGIEWYDKTYFATVKKERMVGEFTPSYLGSDIAPSRIFNSLGSNVKLVLLLRNPVERAYSHYLHSKRDLYENLEFEEALFSEKKRLLEFPELTSRFSYIRSGMYHQQIKNYLKFFDKNQMHVILFDDFLSKKDEVVNELFRFLNLELATIDLDIHQNPARVARFDIVKNLVKKESILKDIVKCLIPSFVLRQGLRNYLHKINNKKVKKTPLSKKQWLSCYHLYFEKEINDLEVLLSLDLSNWKKC